ncbi:hypothetical protein H4R19_005876 [Coemansia spiralis]|nr:hypothetical protein H4R19_005876 [Coemansia spiralis]
MNGHVAAAAAVAGYQSSYGLADGSSAAAGGMVGLIASPTGASWGPSPTSPLSSHSAVAALAAGQQHQSPSAWYNSVYQQSQYSPAGHNMVMYHDSYAQSPSAAAAAAAAYYPPRARLTTTLWEDEQTLVYQVDCRGICVARRHDDNMINGTKLLNVVGMSRGKRDGILKNEKGRRVVKVGPMHLKGVWIPFDRARFLAEQFKVIDALFPIFQPDPNSYLYGTIPMASPTSAAGLPTSDPYSAAAAGYSQLARAQDAYDPSGVVAAAAAAAAATGQSSPVSHSHTASLSQVMAAHHQQPTAHAHHHSMGQQQQQQQQQQGLGISYIGGAPSARMPGMPASPPGSAMAVSPAASYTEKTTRYTPYSTAFQTATGAKSSGPGSKRGSVDHHYSQVVHPSMPQQPHSAKAAQRPDGQGSAADQDGMSQQQQQQQSAMSSSYFEGLMAKSSEQ